MAEPKVMSESEVQDAVARLASWELRDGRLRKQYQFRTFLRAVAFVNSVAYLAESAGHHPDITILHCPFLQLDGEEDGVRSDAVVVLNLTEGIILIAGTAYAGEMKKSVFTAMNYYLPLDGVLSLHSAANVDPRTGKSALFFGLSGTGTKAGGSEYLLHFVEPRSVTENTMRHGFAPGLG